MKVTAYRGIAYHLKEIALILKERTVIGVYNVLYIGDAEFDNLPTWQKIPLILFMIMLPFICSIDGIEGF